MPRWVKILLETIVIVLAFFVLLLAGFNWYRGNFTVGSSNGSYGIEPTTRDVEIGMGSGLASDSFKMVGENTSGMPTPVSSNEVRLVERLIIKTGEISVVVKDVPVTIKSIANYAEKNGGFVVNSQISKSGLAPYGEITVRIPSKEFEKGILEVKSLGDVQRENVVGQDVTEEYVDLDSRLRNLMATEKQFLAILAKAEKITDILAVQRELSDVRSNIEVLQGRMKYLKTSADMSSLTVYLSTDPSVLPTIEDSNEWKPLAVLKAAVRGLIVVGKSLANLVIYFAVFIPLWILIALVVWVVRMLVLRARRRSEGMNFKR